MGRFGERLCQFRHIQVNRLSRTSRGFDGELVSNCWGVNGSDAQCVFGFVTVGPIERGRRICCQRVKTVDLVAEIQTSLIVPTQVGCDDVRRDRDGLDVVPLARQATFVGLGDDAVWQAVSPRVNDKQKIVVFGGSLNAENGTVGGAYVWPGAFAWRSIGQSKALFADSG